MATGQMNRAMGTLEAARRLGVTREHVSRLAQAGKLVSVRVGRVYALDPRDVERYDRERREPIEP